MTRKPTFWIILALLGLAGSVVAFRLFPVAFPILSVDIEMDRQGALDQARELAGRFQWDSTDFRQAASFGHLDPAFQTYMELEGGGLEELNRLVRGGVFTLYAWRVRHFADGAVEEAEVRLTPLGKPYGFRLRLSEETPGGNLGTEQAQELAKAGASTSWGMDPSLYELLESSQEERPGGRLDHIFVYERSDLALGEARVRLRLGVSGDQLTEVTPVLHVPEGFLRRYQDTRNANESISLAGTIIFLLLFLVLGGGVGTVHLLRKRWIEWKAPLAWGGLVAGLMALNQVNSLPLAWMEYDTALPPQIYVATLVVMAGLTFVAGTVFLALIFMAGEGLMRLGFPDQIQQWKMWAPGVANSTPALGRTAAPYLILGVKLGFVVAFYLATSRLFGWWSPASAMVNPDLLATHLPWLTAVSTSLFAAFSEESIFRAIPIGAAAILGRRYGKPGLWIWGVVILQALVFGASHANYPQQPAFARVVEIFPTYLAWGAICVYFGLIPSIIGHFTYNLVLFSLPLFAAETTGIWFDRLMIIAAGILPLAVVLVVRLRKGGVTTAPDWALNRNWRPPIRSAPEAETPGAPAHVGPEPERTPGVPGPQAIEPRETGAARRPLSPRGIAAVVGVALVGLTLWITGLETASSPQLTLTRLQAEAEARSALEDRGVSLGADWIPLFSVAAERSLAHQFVWREGSEEEYQELVGDFLNSPSWRVRFVSFEVPPEDRAESYTVSLLAEGRTPRVSHVLPEGRPGETLTEEEARVLALRALEDQLGTTPAAVREISAEEAVRPDRTDWTFTFAATEGYRLAEGDGRAEVRIAGDEVVRAGKFVHVPEDWEREWRAEESRKQLAIIPSAGLLVLLALGALILAILRWTRGSLFTPPLRVLTGVMVTILLIAAINEWPNTTSLFTTQMSFSNQAVLALLGLGLGLAVLAVGVGLFAALGHTWIQARPPSVRSPSVVGLALGVAYIGLSVLLSRLGPDGPPGWPGYGGAVSYLPWLSTTVAAVIGFLTATAVALLLLATLERLLGTRWSWAGIPMVLLIGLTVASNPHGASWLIWAGGAAGLAAGIGLLWVLCRRLGWAILPGVVAAPVLLGIVEATLRHPYPGHTLGAVFGMAGVVAAMHLWTRAL